MTAKRKNTFDVPIDGVSERYLSMGQLLRAFHACRTSDPETAQAIMEYACDCGSMEAKLEYSIFLRTTPALTMPQVLRYSKAEELLKELLNILDLPGRFAADAALELGTLYADCLHRPVGALSLFLYARRLGATVEEYRLKELRGKLEKMDINHLGSSCEDALRLGKELHRLGETPKLTELFLREALDKAAQEMASGRSGAQNRYGQACLALGDYYDDRRFACAAHERSAYRAERDRMYAAAEKYGYPEYLTRN